MRAAKLVGAGILLMVLVAVVVPVTVKAAGHRDFDTVVTAVEHRYDARAERVPVTWLVSLCARVATGGGVKGMRIAEFDHLTGVTDADELDKLVSDSLGGEWERFVAERERSGELDLIYVQPDGHAMRMLIADYKHDELDVVRMEVNADWLQRWMMDPGGSAKRHDYGTDKPD